MRNREPRSEWTQRRLRSPTLLDRIFILRCSFSDLGSQFLIVRIFSSFILSRSSFSSPDMMFAMALEDCLLCRKIASPPANEVVWEFPHSIAFLGPWQHYRGYCVVVCRTHAAEMHHLPEAIRQAFFEEMCVVSRAIETAFCPRKINVESLGNQVQHPHWHLFPRSADDPENLKAVWLALDRAEKDEDETRRLQASQLPREEIIARLRAALPRPS